MKTYNAALQAQLDAYLSEQSGLPQSKAAAMIGVSPTALSQYRNSKYPGDVEAVESKIEEFLRTRSAAAQAEAEKAPYLSAGYVPTSVSEDVYKAIQYCQLERGIVVLHGDAGIGKTRGAARFVQDNPANAIYIRCTPVGGTLTAMLRQLGTALKLPATRNRLELSMAIHDRLKGTDKVIIIDEAQNLRFDALEELRSLSDPDDLTGESGTGICLIGNSEVYSRMLGKQEAQFAQQFSRVRFRRRYSTADVKLADVEKLFPTLADGSHGKELAFMTGVCRSKWGIRGAMSVYTNAVRNENTSLDGLRGITLTNLFQIDGKSLYAPDCDIEPSYSDLDSSDSGRDEAGYMHREVVREKVATWPIAYSCLTDDEYKYTIGLFAGKATFQFTHPKAGSSTETETTTCYCSKYGIAWHNAKTKQWKNLKFNIIEC